MTTKVILYFPSDATDKAVTYDLVKRYDLRINILRAEIEAGRSGSLLVELTGEESMVREGVAYLERNGVTVSPVASKIAYDRDRCIDCGNCALACFPQALTIGAPDWRLHFDPERCIALQTLPQKLPSGSLPYRIHRSLSRGVRRAALPEPHGADAVVFTVSHRESDLWIAVDRGDAAVMAARTEHFLHELRGRLDRYLDRDPAYLRALVPCLPRPDAPPLLHEMAVAAATAGIGPMSAVAGAFARETGRMLRREFGVGEVVVENGGDIYADVHRPLDVALFAGESPLSERVGLHIPGGAFPLGICTSSGTVGPSLSFGRADAVMIVCCDVLLADSYATAWANRVRTEEDTGSVVERACRVPEILGAMAVKGERLAVGGTFELRLFGEARDF